MSQNCAKDSVQLLRCKDHAAPNLEKNAKIQKFALPVVAHAPSHPWPTLQFRPRGAMAYLPQKLWANFLKFLRVGAKILIALYWDPITVRDKNLATVSWPTFRGNPKFYGKWRFIKLQELLQIQKHLGYVTGSDDRTKWHADQWITWGFRSKNRFPSLSNHYRETLKWSRYSQLLHTGGQVNCQPYKSIMWRCSFVKGRFQRTNLFKWFCLQVT